MGNQQEESIKPDVTIKLVDGQYKVDPAIKEVEKGQTINLLAEGVNVKIGFPEPITEYNANWITIKKDTPFPITISEEIKKGIYFYAVMCEHYREFWYAEGNSCPGMKVG